MKYPLVNHKMSETRERNRKNHHISSHILSHRKIQDLSHRKIQDLSHRKIQDLSHRKIQDLSHIIP